MIIHLERHTCYFVQIDRRALEDPRLSWKATGLLAYLLSKPGEWKIDLKHLMSVKPGGRDCILTGLQELARHGYAEVINWHGPDGRFLTRGYVVREEPTGGYVQPPDGCKTAPNRPQSENPPEENPSVGKSPPSKNYSSSEKEKAVSADEDFSSSGAEEDDPEGGNTPPCRNRADDEKPETPADDFSSLCAEDADPADAPPPRDVLDAAAQQRATFERARAALARLAHPLYHHLERAAWEVCLPLAGGKRDYVLRPMLESTMLTLWQQGGSAYAHPPPSWPPLAPPAGRIAGRVPARAARRRRPSAPAAPRRAARGAPGGGRLTMGRRIRDLTGQRFGDLVVLALVRAPGAPQAFWRCRCACGRETIVRSNNLRTGNTQTCGCGVRGPRRRPRHAARA